MTSSNPSLFHSIICVYSLNFVKNLAKFPQTETSTLKNYIISSVQVCTQRLLSSQFSYFPTAVISGNIWAICPCGLNWYFISCLQTSLASLMTTLSQSHPYFVRCVKPNEKKVRSNSPQVIHQMLRAVSCLGANVSCRRRAGNMERGSWFRAVPMFRIRDNIPHFSFWKLFELLSFSTEPPELWQIYVYLILKRKYLKLSSFCPCTIRICAVVLRFVE